MKLKITARTYWIIATLALILLLALILRKMRREQNKQAALHPNMKAFLWMIRVGEGTANANGYRTLFGGKLFTGFAQHPNVKVPFRNTYSTAAGAYQFLYRTWIAVQAKLGLPDFGPESQDIAAVEKIRERGAYDLVLAGKFEAAVAKVAKEWASIPGSPYGQPTKTLAQAKAAYLQAGGTIA